MLGGRNDGLLIHSQTLFFPYYYALFQLYHLEIYLVTMAVERVENAKNEHSSAINEH